MQDFSFFPGIVMGVAVSGLLNVVAMVAFRYGLKWQSCIAKEFHVVPPEDEKSAQYAVVVTEAGEVRTELTAIDDLLPLRGRIVYAPSQTGVLYFTKNLALMDIRIAWPVCTNLFMALVAGTVSFFTARTGEFPASIAIGMVALPMWAVWLGIHYFGAVEKMSKYQNVLSRLLAPNNSLQARRP